jgi:antitoxin component YwqK of YwqJK toxin-antitoxin module
MSRKIILTRKRSELIQDEEESQKRARLEEDVAQILQNFSKEIVSIPTPFHQEDLDEIHLNKKVFLTKILSYHLSKNDDHVFIYQHILNIFNDNIQKYREPSLISTDKNYIPKVYYTTFIKDLVENSPFKDYFTSKILNSTKLEYNDVIALFRTHVYDKTISGIENQEQSIYDQPCKISRYIAHFLSLSRDTKMRRIEVYNKILEYIESKSLIEEKDGKKNVILDITLKKLFMLTSEKVNYYTLYSYIRFHIIYDNTLQKVSTELEPNPYILNEFYVNSENKPHGPIQSFFSNGNIKLESYYVNGIQSGLHRTFYENGRTRSIKTYLNGKYEGVCMLFDITGNLIIYIEYKNNIAVKTKIGF